MMYDPGASIPPTAPSPGAAAELRPFAGQPGRWERECRLQRRLLAETDSGGPAAWPPRSLRIMQHTSWGWLRWRAPLDGAEPQSPDQIGVLAPEPSRTAVAAQRWLTRRQPQWRVSSLPLPAALAALISFVAGLRAMAWGAPVGVAAPLMLLIPLYVTILPRHLDAAARRRVRIIENDPACVYLIRLVVRHSQIARAAAATEIPELEHAVRLSRRVLWDAAGLLEARATWPYCDAQLRAYEDLCTALAQQAAEALAAQQDLDAAVAGRGDVDDAHLDGAEESAAAQGEALLPLQALAEASTALGELTASHRYAASRLNSLNWFRGRL